MKKSLILLVSITVIFLYGCGKHNIKQFGNFPEADTANFYVTASGDEKIKGKFRKHLDSVAQWQETDMAKQLNYFGFGVKRLGGEKITGPLTGSYIIKIRVLDFRTGKHIPFVGNRGDVKSSFKLLDIDNNILLEETLKEHSMRNWGNCVKKMNSDFIEKIRDNIL